MRGIFSLLMWFAALVFVILLAVAMLEAISSPTYQDGLTARYQAQEQTRQVQAQEWNATLRAWGQWGGGALAVVVVAGVGGWAAVQWQRERTRRTVAEQEGRTDRRRISAQERVAIAWIEGNRGRYPDARPGDLNGVAGVLIPSRREFVPLDVCAAELDAARLLAVDAGR